MATHPEPFWLVRASSLSSRNRQQKSERAAGGVVVVSVSCPFRKGCSPTVGCPRNDGRPEFYGHFQERSCSKFRWTSGDEAFALME